MAKSVVLKLQFFQIGRILRKHIPFMKINEDANKSSKAKASLALGLSKSARHELLEERPSQTTGRHQAIRPRLEFHSAEVKYS